MRPFIASLILVCSASFAREVPGPMKDFYQPDVYYENACTDSELSRLKNLVLAVARKRAPNDAWTLVNEMLCGVSEDSKIYVVSHTRESLLYESNLETKDGSPEVKQINGNKIELVRMSAWGAGVANEEKIIQVHYFPSSICASSFELVFEQEQWMIASIGIYCD